MFSAEELEKLKEIFGELWADHPQPSNGKSKSNDKRDNNRQNGDEGNGLPKCFELNPSSLLIIAGLVVGVFSVESLQVNRNQIVQIVLVGNLRRKTELEKVMEQVGKQPFDQVMKAILANNM